MCSSILVLCLIAGLMVGPETLTIWYSRRRGRVWSSLCHFAWEVSPASNLFSSMWCKTRPALIWVINSSIGFSEAFLRRVSDSYVCAPFSSISFGCLCRRIYKLWLVSFYEVCSRHMWTSGGHWSWGSEGSGFLTLWLKSPGFCLRF